MLWTLEVCRLDRHILSKISQENSLLREAFTGRLEPQLCSRYPQTATVSFAFLLLILPNAICPIFRDVRPCRDCFWPCIFWLHPHTHEIGTGTIFFLSCPLFLRGVLKGNTAGFSRFAPLTPTFPVVQVLPQKTSCWVQVSLFLLSFSGSSALADGGL